MRKFDWGTAIGFGLIIGFFCFLLSVGAAVTGTSGLEWIRLILALLAGTFAYLLAGVVQRSSRTHMFRFGLVWAIAFFAGEYLATTISAVPFTGFWEEWLGTAFVLLAPWSRFHVQMHEVE